MAQYFFFSMDLPSRVREIIHNFSFNSCPVVYDKQRNIYELLLKKTELEITSPSLVSGLLTRTLDVIAQANPIYSRDNPPLCQFSAAQYQVAGSYRKSRKKFSEEGHRAFYQLLLELTNPVVYQISKKDRAFNPSELKTKKKKR